MIAEIDGDLAREAAAALGDGRLGVQCDVSRADDVERAFDACLERFGRIDILVNNAAVVGPAVRHFLELDEQTWDLVLDVNLKGHYLCARARRGHMVEQGTGVIINVSSGGASRAHRGMVAYDASKGGVEAFTRAVAVDLAPYGVRCACIVPGLMETADRPNDGDRARRAPRRCRSAARAPAPTSPERPCSSRARTRATSPDRASTWTAACCTSSARRRSRPSRSSAFRGSADWPDSLVRGMWEAPYSHRSYVCALSRTAGREPTIRGRPQLLHDLSLKLYLMPQRDRGQTMAEYAVVLAVIAIGIFVALGSLRGSIGGALGKVTSDI